MFFRKKDPDHRPIYGTHPGDLGIVVIAAIITLGFVYLLLTPQNFGAMFAGGPAKPQAEPAARKGETPMMIYDAKKK
jgi:glycine/D-amino acid oxidase-like deaminating enzyme